MSTVDRAYLSILGWPGDFDEARRVEALVGGAGMDPYLAGQMARREPPAIVHQFDGVVREDVVNALHAMGVLALAPSRSEIRAYPEPVVPQELERFPNDPGAFAVRTRDGGAWTFRSEDVRLVVAGRVRQVGQVRHHKEGGRGTAGAYLGTGIDGVVASSVLRAMNDAPTGWGSGTTRNTRAVDVIDLHAVVQGRPTLVRLTGPNTRVGVIGEERKRPSLLDEHRRVEDLRALMPGVAFDLGFENFNPPTDVEQQADAAGQGSSRLNPVAFHFYSVWSALLDRQVHGW